MVYSFKDARNTFLEYIDKKENELAFLDNTNKRGLIFDINDNEKCIIFLYPISHKKDNTKNFFDTRDSGVKERTATWNYAIENNLKYFCFAVNDQVDIYKDYIFSLESDEEKILSVSGTLNGKRNGKGTQVVIPKNFIPSTKFERICTDNGFYISAIHKNYLKEYINTFDNRPYGSKFICTNKFTINKPHQRIFFGAPGTGKSYKLNKEAKENFGENYERVTFHPNYMYGNFVGTFKPFPKILKNADGTIKKDTDGNIQESITYEYIPGILISQLIKALKNPNENYLLLIEEINRANVAAVFGDIFQLLDRSYDGESEYSISTSKELQAFLKKEFEGVYLNEYTKKKLGDNFETLFLPNNFFIWATMNSSDQGVMPLDTAFRRRWEFEYLGVNDAADENADDFKNYNFKIDSGKKVNWDKFRRKINNKLSLLNVPEDKLMGPYFIPKAILEDEDLLTENIKNKVLMYLYEDAAKSYRSSLFADKAYYTYSSLCNYFETYSFRIFKGAFYNELSELVEDED